MGKIDLNSKRIRQITVQKELEYLKLDKTNGMKIYRHKIAGIYLGLKCHNGISGRFYKLDDNFNKIISFRKNNIPHLNIFGSESFESAVCRMENVEPFNHLTHNEKMDQTKIN